MNRRPTNSGFSFLELLVSVGVVMLLLGMLLPTLAPAGRKSNRIKCVNNLKNIGLSIRILATDNQGRTPMEKSLSVANGLGSSNQVQHYFLQLSDYLSTPKILICPDDHRKRVKTWGFSKEPPINSEQPISYFLGTEATGIATNLADNNLFLSGDRNITNGTSLNRNILQLSADRKAGWTHEIHKQQGNIVMNDGSVQHSNDTKLNSDIRNVPGSGMKLLMPD